MSDSCHPMDCNPQGSSVYRIFQASVLGWLPFPSPGDLPDPGIEPRSPVLQADSLPTELPVKPKHMYVCMYFFHKKWNDSSYTVLKFSKLTFVISFHVIKYSCTALFLTAGIILHHKATSRTFSLKLAFYSHKQLCHVCSCR